MRGLSQTLEADGLLVAAHTEAGAAVLLFKDGAAEYDPGVAHALLDSAVETLDQLVPSTETISISDDNTCGTALTATLLVRGFAITLTSLLRDGGERPLAAARNRLASLLPVAWPFFDLWSQRKDTAHRQFGLETALHNTFSSTLLLDRAGRLVFANAAAKEYLDSGRGLAINRGRLRASSLTETLRLAAAIEHLCSPSRGDKSLTPVLAIRRRNLRPLMVTLAVAASDDSEDDEPVIVARLFDPEQDPSDLIEPACRFYGLSLSETRLTRLIAEGRTIAAAAATMGVREQTARSYLKQIFLKTETNRQAELVALMLRSAVRLSPRCRTQVF